MNTTTNQKQYVGFYNNKYTISKKIYTGPNNSLKCFIFSGQGSSHQGMFKEFFLNNQPAMQRLKSIDDLCVKYKLPKISDYILNNQKDNADLHKIKNLAQFSCQTILAQFLEDEWVNASIITSHSFGEYAAICYANIIDFETMFDIIYMRDFFSPTPYSIGQMIAIKSDEQSIKTLLNKIEFQIANINSPKQLVISISNSLLDAVTLKLKNSKIAFQVLKQMPQPYHSSLMSESSLKFRNYLKEKNISFSPPRIPFLSSVTRKIIDKNNFSGIDIVSILAEQLILPVDFIEQVNIIYKWGVQNFIEINSSSICDQFVRDTLNKQYVNSTNIDNYLIKLCNKSKTEYTLNSVGSNFFQKFASLIGRLTGYDIKEISTSANFQSDLGIDSIKKAEIIFQFTNENQINTDVNFDLSSFKNVGDFIEYIQDPTRISNNKKESSQIEKYKFKRYQKDKSLASLNLSPDFEISFTKISISELIKFPETRYFNTKSNQLPTIYLLDLDIDISSINLINIKQYLNSITPFLKDLINCLDKSIYLFLSFYPNNASLGNAISSLIKSIQKESNHFIFKSIFFESKIEFNSSFLSLLKMEIKDPNSHSIYYSNQLKRHIVHLKELPHFSIQNGITNNLNHLVIVSIGGNKGIMFELLSAITKNLKCSIYILGRSSPNETEISANIKFLQEFSNDIEYTQLDVSNKKDFTNFIDKIIAKHDKIDYLINSTGIEHSRLFSNKTQNEINEELESKLLPIENMQSLGSRNIKCIIHFSSIVSFCGNEGQSIYSFSNSLLDYQSREDYKNSKTFVKVIHWPPWNNVGMTKKIGITQSLKASGVQLLDIIEAQELFLLEIFNFSDRSVFISTDNDNFLFQYKLMNLNLIAPHIGLLTNTNPIIFKNNINLSSNIFFKGHIFNDQIVYPASLAIATHAYLGSMYKNTLPVINQFTIHNILILQSNEIDIKTVLNYNDKDEILSCNTKSNINNFSSNITFKNPNPSQFEFRREKKFRVNLNSLYSKDCLDFKTSFQILQNVYVDTDWNSITEIDISLLPKWTHLNTLDLIINLIESSFQSFFIEGASKHKCFSIPTYIDKIQFFFQNEITGKLFCAHEIIKIENNKIFGNSKIYDTNNVLIIEMNEIQFSIIKTYQTNPILLNSH